MTSVQIHPPTYIVNLTFCVVTWICTASLGWLSYEIGKMHFLQVFVCSPSKIPFSCTISYTSCLQEHLHLQSFWKVLVLKYFDKASPRHCTVAFWLSSTLSSFQIYFQWSNHHSTFISSFGPCIDPYRLSMNMLNDLLSPINSSLVHCEKPYGCPNCSISVVCSEILYTPGSNVPLPCGSKSYEKMIGIFSSKFMRKFCI